MKVFLDLIILTRTWGLFLYGINGSVKKENEYRVLLQYWAKERENSWLKWSRDAANNLPMTPKVIWRKSAISSSCVPADTAKIKNYTRKYGRQRKSYNLPYLTKAAVWGEVRMFNLCLCWYWCRCRWSMWFRH